jgi:hypothetical protein
MFVTFGGLEHAELQSGTGIDTIEVTTVPIPLTILSGAGNDSVSITASTAPVTVHTGSEQPSLIFGGRQGDSLIVGFIPNFPATVVVEQDDTVVSLSVAADSTLRIGAGAVLNRVAPTFIDFGLGLSGAIDLADGALLWRASSNTPDFRTFLARGRNGGLWNGTNAEGAINSSAAAGSAPGDGVGYGLSSQIGISAIGSFAINPGDILLRYTLDGDADLSGSVDVADLGRLASNWQGSGKVWSQGDSNYDSQIDVADLGALASNWQLSAAARSPSSPGTTKRIPGSMRAIDLMWT